MSAGEAEKPNFTNTFYNTVNFLPEDLKQGRPQGGVGVNPPLSLIFYKTLLPAQ